jgi:hypothetical protein
MDLFLDLALFALEELTENIIILALLLDLLLATEELLFLYGGFTNPYGYTYAYGFTACGTTDCAQPAPPVGETAGTCKSVLAGK